MISVKRREAATEAKATAADLKIMLFIACSHRSASVPASPEGYLSRMLKI
jgi:hypothetical protein